MINVAVVILNYNGKELLKKFLPSVIQFSEHAEIVVADNNSSDGSQELVGHHFPTVKLIAIPHNLGYCGGYNYALRQVAADYYILLNSDIEVTSNWISPIIDLLERDKTIGAVQPKILSYKERDKFEYAGAAGGFVDKLGYPFCRGRIFNSVEKDIHQYDDTISVFWGTGACLFIRATLFKRLGGFDEDFFAHMEEIDLCWRLRQIGYRVVYCSSSSVYHVGGATLSSSSDIKTYYNFRNGIMLLIKNMRLGQLLRCLPIRFVLDWVAALKFLIEGSPLNSLAVLRAHLYLIKKSAMLRKKRAHVKALISSYDTGAGNAHLIYNGFIVFDYFIMGRQSYRDLKFHQPK